MKIIDNVDLLGQIFYEDNYGILTPVSEVKDWDDILTELQEIKMDFLDKKYEILKETQTQIKFKDHEDNKFSFIALIKNSK